MPTKREPQPLISNADAVDQWCEATRRLRGDVPLSEVCGFASRIESLVRKRLAERLNYEARRRNAERTSKWEEGAADGIAIAARLVEED